MQQWLQVFDTGRVFYVFDDEKIKHDIVLLCQKIGENW